MPDQPTDHAGLETLPFEVCLRLLASVPIGRVGFCADGEVVMLPVNHAVDGQDVVFRTAGGSKLTAAQEQNLVAFEADSYDVQTRSGWSILVTGRATVVYDEAEVSALNRLNLHPWATSVEHPFWIRIRPVSVTGRRTPVPAGRG
ncbi:MAG TPA: pyridoxamine 5'-phosphate oxidase family protein [Streptosporangiaceae bacterium]|nr:pyridoxamine 5'-phosphate oxidase family protein [Streptosporangiaceae bacterium]